MKNFATPFFIVLLFAFSQNAFAQKETNNWYFGNSAGLDFSNGDPVPMYDGKVYTTEGSAVMSDTAGNLLFYTDGVFVFNANHDTMPNGKGLFGDVSSSTQSALIVPQPGNTGIYYVFTVPANAGQETGATSDALCYSIVDMSLDGGMGDVTAQKNISLMSLSTEKVSGVQNADGDYWIAAHKWGTNEFYVYKLSATGLSAPVISSVGTVHAMPDNRNTNGQMKFSPGGTKIGLGIGYQDTYEVLDFDLKTGIISNPVTLSSIPGYHAYGFEFSPNGRFVYTSTSNNVLGTYTIDQYDLKAADPSASRVTISAEDGMRAMQLARNGKIYVANGFSYKIGVINSPNLQGTAADYEHQSVSVNDDPNTYFMNQAALGLPNFVQSYFQSAPDADFFASETSICLHSCISFTDKSLGEPYEWKWYFDGTLVATSDSANPARVCYDTSGVFEVKLVIKNFKGEDSLVRTQYITVAPSGGSGGTVTAFRNPVCENSLAQLTNAGSGPRQWQSSDDAENWTDIAGETNSVYLFIATAEKYYRVAVSGNCPGVSDTLLLQIIPSPIARYDYTISGFTVNYNSDSSEGEVAYIWSFGDGDSSTMANPSHVYAEKKIYQVCLTVRNPSNCYYTLCRNIDLNFSGINEITNEELKMHPVPFTNELNLDALPDGTKQIEVYDVLGRNVLTKQIGYSPGNAVKLDVGQLGKGMYLLKIKTANGDFVTRAVKQ